MLLIVNKTHPNYKDGKMRGENATCYQLNACMCPTKSSINMGKIKTFSKLP
jgi:hypothetical protein